MTLSTREPGHLAEQTDEGLVELAREGQELALRTLLGRYRPVVRARCRGYYLRGAERDDVIQEGMIGLYKAVRLFDPSRTPSFAAFARLCIDRQVINAVRAAARHKHSTLTWAVPLDVPTDDVDQQLGDRLVAPGADPADHVVSRDDLRALRSFCAENLSALEREVLALHSQGEGHAAIAAAVGRHRKAVDNALQRTRRKLEEYARGGYALAS